MKSIISSPLSRGGHLLESERRFVRRWMSRWRGIDYLDAPIRRYDTLGRRPTSTKRKASLTRTNRNGTCCYRRKQGNNYTGVFCTDLDRGRDSCEPANTLVLKLSTFTFLDAPLPHAANLFATCKNKREMGWRPSRMMRLRLFYSNNYCSVTPSVYDVLSTASMGTCVSYATGHYCST